MAGCDARRGRDGIAAGSGIVRDSSEQRSTDVSDSSASSRPITVLATWAYASGEMQSVTRVRRPSACSRAAEPSAATVATTSLAAVGGGAPTAASSSVASIDASGEPAGKTVMIGCASAAAEGKDTSEAEPSAAPHVTADVGEMAAT